MFSNELPSDIPRPCECCAQAHVWRDGLCRACDEAERNYVQADLADHAQLTGEDVDHFAATSAENDNDAAPFRGTGVTRVLIDTLDVVAS